MKVRRNKQSGFSLIELLVVVAIVLIIAALFVPSILNSIRASRETAAASTLRQVGTSETGYRVTYNTVSPDALSLGGDPIACEAGAVSASASCELNNDFVKTMTKASYTFTRTSTPTTYFWMAIPSNGILSGRREFCVTNGGVHATPMGTIGAISDSASCLAQPAL